MRIFVTGTEGYWGSLLTVDLLRFGYEVTGLDTGFYKERMLYRDGGPTPLTPPHHLRDSAYATAYGASPWMRFNIVLDNLAGLAWTTKEIKMTSDGTPWRPWKQA